MATRKGRAAPKKAAAKAKAKPAKRSASKPKITAAVTLRGRFRPGQRVKLVRAAGPGQLRAGGADDMLAVKRVRDDGSVEFTNVDGVEVGGRYFAVGYVNGTPLEVRLVGREPGDNTGLGLDPVGVAEVRHGDGTVVGERGGAGQKLDKPAVPAHPDPSGKDVQRDSSPPPASSAYPHEFPDVRPAVPVHPGDPNRTEG